MTQSVCPLLWSCGHPLWEKHTTPHLEIDNHFDISQITKPKTPLIIVWLCFTSSLQQHEYLHWPGDFIHNHLGRHLC